MINVTLYNGDLDLICDWIGTANYSHVIGFSSQAAFNAATEYNWNLPNLTNAGTVSAAANLARVTISGAGHMVPFDQPESALTMMRKAIAFNWN
jgi:cathepsin A (carboxypeptidase C)